MTAPIAERLRQAAENLPAQRVTLRVLAQAHGAATQGTLLLLLAAPCLLPVPGVGSVLGLGMAALAAAMWRGHAEHSLPSRVADFDMPRAWARRVLLLLAAAYAAAGRVARERLHHLTSPGSRTWTASTVALMAFIIVLPIPLGNVLPALATMLLGLGLVFRDGVAVLLGFAMAALALVATAGLALALWAWGAEWVTRWVLF